MFTAVQSYYQRLRSLVRQWALEPRVHLLLRLLGASFGGFVLSATSLSHYMQPVAMAFICALTGIHALVAALGAAGGYLLFWGNAGLSALAWCVLGLFCSLTLGDRATANRNLWLMATLSGLCVAVMGLWLQYKGQQTPPAIYLLQIAMATLSTALFSHTLRKRDTVTDWLVLGIAVLALCQILPFGFCLGFPAAAAITVSSAFPAAALSGLALDLAAVSSVPMTAVLSMSWLMRLFPLRGSWKRALTPALSYGLIMALTGHWDLSPLPGLAVGGLLGLLLPGPKANTQRRGETGIAQVRLEMTAEVYRQMEQLLLELKPPMLDQQALLQRACEKACSSCSFRKTCTGKEQAQALPIQILEQPLSDSSLGFSCRRTGRLLHELQRSQEHLRLLRFLHRQQAETRQALIQQYRFLSLHLENLSDGLCRKAGSQGLRYTPEVAFGTNRAAADNGDRCLQFYGTANRYYVALLDGMGTGIGAADEATQAGLLLKGLLSSGFPANHALATLNSLCALRNRAGVVTVDLVEVELDTGCASVYKWGAPPAWLIRKSSYEKIGTATPPPGLHVSSNPEGTPRLSLRRGEVLLLLSDGLSGEDALCAASIEAPLCQQTDLILSSAGEDSDDATVALVRLRYRDLTA